MHKLCLILPLTVICHRGGNGPATMKEYMSSIGIREIFVRQLYPFLDDIDDRRTCEISSDSCYAVFDGIAAPGADGIEIFENVKNTDQCKECCDKVEHCNLWLYEQRTKKCSLKSGLYARPVVVTGVQLGLKCNLDPFCRSIDG